MDFSAIIGAISTVGYPIILSILLLWYIKTQSEDHKLESEKFTDALNKNTLVLQKLCDKLGVENDDK